MDRGEFIRLGFRCVPAINGGWMLSTHSPDPGEVSDRAAFSTFAEMIAWLQDQHEGLDAGKDGPEPGPKMYEYVPNNRPAFLSCSFGCTEKVASTECYIHGGARG